MVNLERKTVSNRIEDVTYSLQAPLADCIAVLQDFLAEYPNAWLSFEDIASKYAPTEEMGLVINDMRLETDEQYNERIKEETELEDRRTYWERQKYEQLKAKFGEA